MAEILFYLVTIFWYANNSCVRSSVHKMIE